MAQRGRHAGHPAGDVAPLLVGVAGHEVEDAAGGLEGRGEDVERTQVVVGLLAFELGVEALEHHVACDAVALVLRLGAFEVAPGGLAQGGARVVAVGREVGQLGLGAGDAEAGREVGVEGGDGADVGVGDFSYLASVLAHGLASGVRLPGLTCGIGRRRAGEPPSVTS